MSDIRAEVIMYTTPWCGYCRAARALLDRKGVAFLGIDVSGDVDRRRWLATTTGRSTVPQIFINGESVGGFDSLSALDGSGELDRMLSTPPPAGAKPPIP